MELAGIAALTYLTGQFLPKGEDQIVPDEGDETLHDTVFQTPRKFLEKEFAQSGYIVEPGMPVAARVPFNMNQPPSHIWRPSDPKYFIDPPKDIYAHVINAREHHRADFEDSIREGYEYFMPKRGGALVQTFTRELHNPADPSMSTGFINFSWLPPNPQDADFVRAGEMARRLPRDPSLFAPDSTFYNAVGLPFRYRK